MRETNVNANRITDRLVEKLANESGRGDISVANYAPIRKDAVRICATYYGERPTNDELRAWALAIGGGKLRFHPETAVDHGTLPKPIISFALSYNHEKMTVAEAEANESMVCVAKNQYLDTEFSVKWRTETIGEKEFVVRDEPQALIRTVEAHVVSAGYKVANLTKNFLNVEADVPNKIMYIRDDMSVGHGFLIPTSVTAEPHQVTVKDIGLKTDLNVATSGIITIVAMSADEKKKVKDFFAKIWTPEMANKITKDL